MILIKYFFVFNARGSPIVVRGSLAEPSQSVVESFFNRLIQSPPPDPIFRLDSLNFAYIISSQLYFVVAAEDSMSPVILLELLSRIVSVIADYAGRCTEVTLQRNLGLTYEIVDEVLSMGCPQATDASNLLHLVHNTVSVESSVLETVADALELFSSAQYDRPLAITLNERSKAANECYFVLRESVELSVDRNNQALRTCVTGQCVCKSYLQGQPSVLLQIDPQMTFATRGTPKHLELTYDDIVFAPFVQAHGFDGDRTIAFAPPQGLSTLFNYRTTRSIKAPFVIIPNFENKQAKVVVVRVSVQSTYQPEIVANEFEIRFQAPVETSNASCELPASVAGKQSGEYEHKSRQVVWRISAFAGLTEYSARFRFIFDHGIPAAAETLLGPLAVQFRIPDLLPSGATVKSVTVSTSGSASPPKKWMKTEAVASGYTFNFI